MHTTPNSVHDRYRAIYPIITELNEYHHEGKISAYISDDQVKFDRGALRFKNLEGSDNFASNDPKLLLFVSPEDIPSNISDISHLQSTQESNVWATGFVILRFIANDQSALAIPANCIDAQGNLDIDEYLNWRNQVIQDLYAKIPQDFPRRNNIINVLEEMLKNDIEERTDMSQVSSFLFEIRQVDLQDDFNDLQELTNYMSNIALPEQYKNRLAEWNVLQKNTEEQNALMNERFYQRNYSVLENIILDTLNDTTVSSADKKQLDALQQRLSDIKPIDYRTDADIQNHPQLQHSAELYRLQINSNMSDKDKLLLKTLIDERLIATDEIKLKKTESSRIGKKVEPYQVQVNNQLYAVELPQSLIALPQTDASIQIILVTSDLLGIGSFGKVKSVAWEIEYDINNKEIISITASDKVNKSQIVDDEKNPKVAIEREGNILNLARSNAQNPASIIQIPTKSGEKIYTIMPQIQGENLDEIDVSNLKIEDRLQNVRSLISDLQHLHARGIVHSDIRESNIKRNEKNQLEFIDFGLAFTVDNPRSGIPGTPPYFAPEVFKDEVDDDKQKLDVWAAGIVALRHLAGKQGEFIKTDFPGGFHAISQKREEYIKDWMQQLEQSSLEKHQKDCLRNVLQKMLEADPKKRITAEQAVEILQGLDKNQAKDYRQTQPQSFSGQQSSQGRVARLKQFYESQARENSDNHTKPSEPRTLKYK